MVLRLRDRSHISRFAAKAAREGSKEGGGSSIVKFVFIESKKS